MIIGKVLDCLASHAGMKSSDAAVRVPCTFLFVLFNPFIAPSITPGF